MPNYDSDDLSGLGRHTGMRSWGISAQKRAVNRAQLMIGAPTAVPRPAAAPTATPISVPANMPGTLPAAWTLITKLRGDVTELSNRIRAMAAGGATGQQLQQRDALNNQLRTQVNALTAQNKKLQSDVADLTNRIRTYNQPPPPGQQPTGLQLAYQNLIRQVQTLQAWKSAHGG